MCVCINVKFMGNTQKFISSTVYTCNYMYLFSPHHPGKAGHQVEAVEQVLPVKGEEAGGHLDLLEAEGVREEQDPRVEGEAEEAGE